MMTAGDSMDRTERSAKSLLYPTISPSQLTSRAADLASGAAHAVTREFREQQRLAAADLAESELKAKRESEYEEAYFREHGRGQRTEMAREEFRQRHGLEKGNAPTMTAGAYGVAEAAAQSTRVEDHDDERQPPRRPQSFGQGKPMARPGLRPPPVLDRPINYDVVVQSYQGVKFPMVIHHRQSRPSCVLMAPCGCAGSRGSHPHAVYHPDVSRGGNPNPPVDRSIYLLRA